MERINNKELNSHDLAREIEIVKLQEENEELKSLLRGTTHCFDEEEHNRLKEEITNLSKEIDMWNSKYNDMFDENRMLKEALETKSYCKYANKCDELDDCSREEYENMANANVRLSVENYDLKEENQELKKQLEEYKDNYNCLLKQKEQFEYIMSKQVDYRGQQKEFINWLEDEKDRLAKKCSNIYEDSLGHTRLVNADKFDEANDILQKYKSIIGDDK